MQQTIKHIARHFLSVRRQACSRAAAVCFVITSIFTISCEREPMLHLHKGGTDISVELPDIDLELQLLWDYLFSYDVEYDWQNEWLYGWDETDNELFAPPRIPRAYGLQHTPLFHKRRAVWSAHRSIQALHNGKDALCTV